MRDVEELLYNTLRTFLSSATGIPSGRIWSSFPNIEFVNKPDGANVPKQNDPRFPAIAITQTGPIDICYNNYGSTITQDNGDGTAVLYTPLGEVKYCLMISLFTNSREQQRDICSVLQQTLLTTRSLSFVNDLFPGEFFSLILKKLHPSSNTVPYHRPFTVDIRTRILNEVSGYVVDGVFTNIGTDFGAADPVYDTEVSVTFDPSNPLVVDLFEEFEEGTFVRTRATL
jgi:hypothetical protein